MRHLVLFAAAGLSLGMWNLGCNKDSGTTSSTDSSSTTAPTSNRVATGVEQMTHDARAAVSPTGTSQLKDAKAVIEHVVENATDRNNFKDMTGYFLADDKNRIDGTKPDTKDLDDAIDAFGKVWNDKYKYSFKIKDIDKTYDDSFISVTADPANGGHAIATIAEGHNLKSLKIDFMDQGGVWRVDVPNTIDGPKLRANLLSTIQDLTKNSASWPDSDMDAARIVTHRIMAAVLTDPSI